MALLPLAAGVGGGVWSAVFGWGEAPTGGGTVSFFGAPMEPEPPYAPDTVKLAALGSAFVAVSAYRSGEITVESAESVNRLVAAVAGEGFFDVLGAGAQNSALLGWPNTGGVVLSARASELLFNGQVAVGSSLRVNGRTTDVAAVLEQGQEYPREADIWLPFGFADEPFIDSAVLLVGVGRPRRSVSVVQMERELERVLGRAVETEPIGERYRRESGRVAAMTAIAASAMSAMAVVTILLLSVPPQGSWTVV